MKIEFLKINPKSRHDGSSFHLFLYYYVGTLFVFGMLWPMKTNVIRLLPLIFSSTLINLLSPARATRISVFRWVPLAMNFDTFMGYDPDGRRENTGNRSDWCFIPLFLEYTKFIEELDNPDCCINYNKNYNYNKMGVEATHCLPHEYAYL